MRRSIGPTTPRYYDDNTLGGSVSYELDLWGQIRNEVAAGEANAAASAADLENARLSLIAQLVDDYIQLRSLDRDSAILDETVKAYTRALSLTEQRHDAGIAPGLDVSQAQTQLDAARSQAAQTLAQRALMEHAIAALLGVSASTFSIKPADRRHHAAADSERRPGHLARAPSGYRGRAAAHDCGQCQHRRGARGLFPLAHARAPRAASRAPASRTG